MTRKKAKRILKLGDAQYRWIVSGNDGYISLFVWKNNTPYQLQVIFDYESEEVVEPKASTEGLQHRSISPSIVRQVIETAIRRGWASIQSTEHLWRFDYKELNQ